MAEFTCLDCGTRFDLPPSVAARYPGWVPKQCLDCRDGGRAKPVRGGSGATDNVLERFDAGPDTGVFTDGGSVPNPGPGGWGAVYVVGGEIVAEASGHDPDTTNNRMELTALIEGCGLVPEGTATTIYSDSNLVVRTVNEWAAGWEKRGWKRKTGPVENLDLVKPLYYLLRSRTELTVRWIKAHAGYRWNEYAHTLADRWRNGD